MSKARAASEGERRPSAPDERREFSAGKLKVLLFHLLYGIPFLTFNSFIIQHQRGLEDERVDSVGIQNNASTDWCVARRRKAVSMRHLVGMTSLMFRRRK